MHQKDRYFFESHKLPCYIFLHMMKMMVKQRLFSAVDLSQSLFQWLIITTFLIIGYSSSAQSLNKVDSFHMFSDVKVSIDRPLKLTRKETVIVLYALPNGNSTTQTMGKKINEGEDWHFDIQHIAAQTAFIREKMKEKNIVVIYLENQFKSWPLWKQKNAGYVKEIQHIVDSLYQMVPARKKSIYLNGHSGGGSFIFGYLQGVEKIPSHIRRISFLDSDYGYDTVYYSKLHDWLHKSRKHFLNVFAYNDSVALYEGKTFVSATGGTWYRSHLMLRHFEKDMSFQKSAIDSIEVYSGLNNRLQFFFKENPDKKIFHTTQVELNGFIHSILSGTKHDAEGYTYYGKRAYSQYIK